QARRAGARLGRNPDLELLADLNVLEGFIVAGRVEDSTLGPEAEIGHLSVRHLAGRELLDALSRGGRLDGLRRVVVGGVRRRVARLYVVRAHRCLPIPSLPCACQNHSAQALDTIERSAPYTSIGVSARRNRAAARDGGRVC